jgi:hypothetical protein
VTRQRQRRWNGGRAAVAHHAVAATLFGVTVGVWAIGELRQLVHTRPEAVKADMYSLVVVRIFLFAGWLVAARSRLVVIQPAAGTGAHRRLWRTLKTRIAAIEAA